MKRPLFLKIFLGFLVVITLACVLTIIFSYSAIRSYYIEQITNTMVARNRPLQSEAVTLFQQNRLAELVPLVKKYGGASETRITIIAPDGTVLADSVVDPATMYNHLTRLEVANALKGRLSRSVRYSPDLRVEMIYVAIPMRADGKILGIIRYSHTAHAMNRLVNTLKSRMILVTVLVAAISLLISLFSAHILTRPIQELQNAAQRIAAGDFDVRVSTATRDELKDLAGGFNQMAEQLQRSFREVSRKQEELQGIIASISEGLFLLNREGKVILSNASAQRIVGHAHLNGKYYWEILRSTFLHELLARKGEACLNAEIALDGRVYLCSAASLPSETATVLLLHDITALRRMERLKKDLVVNVSHELNTPLTAIKGFTETLLEDAGENDRRYLSIIRRHTERLILIVKDLLTLSELEEKEPVFQREVVDIKALCEGLLGIFEPRAQAKGLTLTIAIPSPLTLWADSFRLEQLFTNLIDNAIKYTEQGSITITAALKGSEVVIAVRDTGLGIAHEHLGRIFERFYVVDKSRSRSLGGTGLGLSIAKHIAALHGGRIEVESALAKGSTFMVVLPVAPEASEATIS